MYDIVLNIGIIILFYLILRGKLKLESVGQHLSNSIGKVDPSKLLTKERSALFMIVHIYLYFLFAIIFVKFFDFFGYPDIDENNFINVLDSRCNLLISVSMGLIFVDIFSHIVEDKKSWSFLGNKIEDMYNFYFIPATNIIIKLFASLGLLLYLIASFDTFQNKIICLFFSITLLLYADVLFVYNMIRFSMSINVKAYKRKRINSLYKFWKNQSIDYEEDEYKEVIEYLLQRCLYFSKYKAVKQFLASEIHHRDSNDITKEFNISYASILRNSLVVNLLYVCILLLIYAFIYDNSLWDIGYFNNPYWSFCVTIVSYIILSIINFPYFNKIKTNLLFNYGDDCIVFKKGTKYHIASVYSFLGVGRLTKFLRTMKSLEVYLSEFTDKSNLYTELLRENVTDKKIETEEFQMLIQLLATIDDCSDEEYEKRINVINIS